MSSENGAPREPATRGRGRGGRGGRAGRGRGGGRGASAAVSKAIPARLLRGSTRRGRAKTFTESHAQASYERQKDIKDNYLVLSNALKVISQTLADRALDELTNRPEVYTTKPAYQPVHNVLQNRLDDHLDHADAEFKFCTAMSKKTLVNRRAIIHDTFERKLEELQERFDEALAERVRILTSLMTKDLPVDVSDERVTYKYITDEQLDAGIDINEPPRDAPAISDATRGDGPACGLRLVDKSRLEAVDAADSAAPSSSATPATPVTRGAGTGRGRGRGANKRRPLEQPNGEPTAKKNTRSAAEAPSPALVPAKGLIAAAAAAHELPEVPGLAAPAALANEPVISSPDKDGVRSRSPALPKNLGSPDEYGFRLFNPRGTNRDKVSSGRILAPRPITFEDWEIGYRDGTNSQAYGPGKSKRGKYFNTPNTSNVFHESTICGYNYLELQSDDFDQELVQRHGVHPRFGVFLPDSVNDAQPPSPCVMPGKPVVYVATPSGRIAHASRSFQDTINHRSATQAPLRSRLGASMRAFCDSDPDTSRADISLDDVLPTVEELRQRSLGTAARELQSATETEEPSDESRELTRAAAERPEDRPEDRLGSEEDAAAAAVNKASPSEEAPTLTTLVYGAAYVEACDACDRFASTQPAPKVVLYDAIRDVFTRHSTPAAPPAAPQHETNLMQLNFLASMCVLEPPLAQSVRQEGAAAAAAAAANANANANANAIGPAPAASGPPAAPVADQPQPLAAAPNHGHPTPPAAAPPVVRDSSVRSTLVTGASPFAPAPYAQAAPTGSGSSNSSSHHAPRPRENLAPARPYADQGPGPVSYAEPRPGQLHRLPSAGPPAHTPNLDVIRYQTPREQGPAPSHHPLMRAVDYPQYPPVMPPAQEQQQQHHPLYYGHGAYPASPRREMHMPPARPMEPPLVSSSGGDRRMSVYRPETPGPIQFPAPNPASAYPPHPMLSPPFPSHHPMLGPMAQSPPSSAHRHRGSGSISSDASGKYRKLQPAPVPPHRIYSAQPELKTIPYDHKELGKRSKADKTAEPHGNGTGGGGGGGGGGPDESR
ncbi:hypothetical protein ESCO_001349 [Escovopsis weberi]|uniref:Uncharacterized protein n=1 Tax=Escovopsis weberi TaxID=150374 RepID=A0A0M8MXW2_ESCWE|nr:hypothetical protein ESCO_001349 [Escovopsis weberi]